jgi:hypothetical protein
VVWKRLSPLAVAGLLVASIVPAVDAGWPFGKKDCECCPTCQQAVPKEKKKSLIGAEEAPAAVVADLIPARYTTARAERLPDPNTKKIPDVPASEIDKAKLEELDAKMQALTLRVNELRLQVEALVIVLEKDKQ